MEGLLFVEPEGFEPSSSKGSHIPSTCIVASWISQTGRQTTTYQICQLLEFRMGLIASPTLVLKFDTP